MAVNWSHQPGSKVNVLLDGLRMVRDVIHIRGNALRGLYDRPHIATAKPAVVTTARGRVERTREREISRVAENVDGIAFPQKQSTLSSIHGQELRP